MNLRDSLRASIALGWLERTERCGTEAAIYTTAKEAEVLMEIVREWATADGGGAVKGMAGAPATVNPNSLSIQSDRAAYKDV